MSSLIDAAGRPLKGARPDAQAKTASPGAAPAPSGTPAGSYIKDSSLQTFAAAHRLRVIEDAAEEHGQTYKGRKVGSFGDITTVSFYPNKHITTGEGGMVTCHTADMAANVRLYRDQGQDPNQTYFHPVMGFNYRLTDLQGAVPNMNLVQGRGSSNATNIYIRGVGQRKARGPRRAQHRQHPAHHRYPAGLPDAEHLVARAGRALKVAKTELIYIADEKLDLMTDSVLLAEDGRSIHRYGPYTFAEMHIVEIGASGALA